MPADGLLPRASERAAAIAKTSAQVDEIVQDVAPGRASGRRHGGPAASGRRKSTSSPPGLPLAVAAAAFRPPSRGRQPGGAGPAGLASGAVEANQRPKWQHVSAFRPTGPNSVRGKFVFPSAFPSLFPSLSRFLSRFLFLFRPTEMSRVSPAPLPQASGQERALLMANERRPTRGPLFLRVRRAPLSAR